MTVPDALIGGRYRLVRRLAAGGMGSVWEAWDERLHRPVAVKQLLIQPGLSREDAELSSRRVMREARITARLHHPHAVPVYDVVDQDGLPCLVMQYLPSTSLQQLLREKGALEPEVVARIGAEIASALAAAHEAGIVHRDVKPGNVLITEDGAAKLTDFGVSHAIGDASLTSTGMVTGTPAFLAPEVARGAESAFSADVFSLGATLYAALEGTPPFGTDDNPMAALHRVASGQIIQPRRSGPLAPLLLRMLSADPAQRPVALDVARTLQALSNDLGAASDAPTERFSAAPIPDRAAPAAAAATAAMPIARPGGPPTAPPPARPAGYAGPPRRRRTPVGALVTLAVVLLLLAVGLAVLLIGHGKHGNTAAPPTTAAPHTTPRPTTKPATSTARTTAASSTTATSTAASSTASSPTAPPSTTPPSSPAAPGQPTAAQLAQAITRYYGLLPGDTNEAWDRLTKSYQHSTAKSRKSYQDFWGSIQRVTTADVTGSSPSSAQATITYYFKDGRVVTERTAYGLVSEGGTLKIDSSSVLSSQ